MRLFRRRLASGALTLTVLQLTLLFAVPACCVSGANSRAGSGVALSDDAPDCCPPGAHPKGECPLHGRKSEAGTRKSSHCRVTCGRTSGPQFVLGAIGVLPAPTAISVPCAESAALVSASATLPFRSSVPDAPPPRLL